MRFKYKHDSAAGGTGREGPHLPRTGKAATRRGGRRDGDARREAIIKAAMRLFGDHGIDAVTVRQIAQAADCNVAAIKYYFGDKSGLLISVLESTISRALEGGEHPVIDPGADPRASLRAWILWVLRTGRRRQNDPGIAPRLLMQSMTIKGPLARMIVERLGGPVRENINTIVGQMFPGGLSEELRHAAFLFIFGICSRFAHAPPLEREMGFVVPEDDGELDVLAERLTNFIVGGLACMTDMERGPGASA
ncbi:MAG: TetR/AcrR family transcriptional regulator [Planctomyces sp.]